MKFFHHLLLVLDRFEVDHRQITTSLKMTGFIQHISNSTGHAGSKISSGFTKDNNDPTGHVFATVVAHAFDHRTGAAVPHAETFRRATAEERLAAGGTIEADVANKDVFLRRKGGYL